MDNENKDEEKKYDKKTYAFIAIGLIIAGAVALGLSFTSLGLYALTASAIFEIAALTFANLQKKKNDFKWLVYIKISAYIVFAAAVLIYVGGTIWAMQNGND